MANARPAGRPGPRARNDPVKLTILNVAYPFAPVGPGAVGGAEQILAHLDRALTTAGHDSIVVACEGSEVTGTLLPTELPRGRLSVRERQAAHQRHRELIQEALERFPVNVVHLHGIDFHTYMPPAGVPVLATLHLPLDWYPGEIFHLPRMGTYFNCVSQSQHDTRPAAAEPDGSECRPVLLPPIINGVPNELCERRHARRSFAFSLGRICPEKGFHFALDAAATAGVSLVLAGKVFPFEEHERYFQEEIVPRLDRSRRFVGPVDFTRKRRWLSAARCLLVPSLAPETSSLVAMEALACGTPVIAFPSGALADIVEPCRTGFLVRSAKEMAEAIQDCAWIDPEACRAAARDRFSIERMASDYLHRYEQLARLQSPGPGNLV
jgi:glycosyltransferase involved in cell wall biosynthesis